VANLAGRSVTTVIVSKKGTVELMPLEAGAAEIHLAALLRAWEYGMRKPLPLALKSAFEWIFRSAGADSEQALALAEKAARSTYEGGFNKGEVQQSASLRRAYPDFGALSASGEFASFSELLLGPLLAAVKKKDKAAANAAGADE
jgi:exodeoxyribonuclease V gamma subunit